MVGGNSGRRWWQLVATWEETVATLSSLGGDGDNSEEQPGRRWWPLGAAWEEMVATLSSLGGDGDNSEQPGRRWWQL